MDGLLSFSGTLVKLPPEKLLNVLIVDDHEVFRYGLRDLVNAIDGFHVIAEASKYEEAQAKYEADQARTTGANPVPPNAQPGSTSRKKKRRKQKPAPPQPPQPEDVPGGSREAPDEQRGSSEAQSPPPKPPSLDDIE